MIFKKFYITDTINTNGLNNTNLKSGQQYITNKEWVNDIAQMK